MDELPQLPPIAAADMSVILLVQDDVRDLEAVVLAWMESPYLKERAFEVILVDDGSTDGSGAVADGLAERFPRVRVVRHTSPLGQGAALRAGVLQAKYPLVLCTLGNKQYEPPDLQQLLGKIDLVDLVSGFRVGRPMPWWVRAWDFGYRWFNRVVFGLPIDPRPVWLGWSGLGRRLTARWIFGVHLHDPECVFRLFRRELFRRMPIQSDGAFAQVEVLAKANFLGAMIAEVPVSFVTGKRATSFAGEAYRLFRHPEFGKVALAGDVVPAPAADEAPKVEMPLLELPLVANAPAGEGPKTEPPADEPTKVDPPNVKSMDAPKS